jgi:hypothetical protein
VLSSGSSSSPSSIATRMPSAIINSVRTHLDSASPGGHPLLSTSKTPPAIPPRNNAPKAATSPIVNVWLWDIVYVVDQRVDVVENEVDILGLEIDVVENGVGVLDLEVDVVENEVDILGLEIDVVENGVGVLDLEVDILENEVEDKFDVDFKEIGFEGADIELRVEFEKIGIEDRGVDIDKDEFRETDDIRKDEEVARDVLFERNLAEGVLSNSAWRVERKHIKITKHNRTQLVRYIVACSAKSIACKKYRKS